MDDPRERLARLMNVSRETLSRLDLFAGLLEKWNPKINLVSPATLPDLWNRHFLDSAQLFQHIGPSATRVADLGSGGGFPAIVLSILLKETAPDTEVTMLESDARKGAFLRTAQRELALNCHVVTERIETATPQDAQAVTARALAPLPKLLSFVDRHLAKTGTAILQKGANWEAEVEEALVNWSFKVQNYTSITDDSAVVLTLTDLERR